ncbi:linker for activation of T-cells family member 2-like isoform X2 [Polypterus senegalus]|uniref:linker for activation of T-cells family member 2-like isoform X2 n=1 Tax=Polypterus senegalus TaxID=55291 RepID=UPI001966C0AA|nr:linker for activation of T-cells family member 2-like isoform X2 [Polypterus senegalus]
MLNQWDVLLTATSLVPLAMFVLICIWCRQRSKIIREENTFYEENMPQERGFVVRSKTVTRPNKIVKKPAPPVPVEKDGEGFTGASAANNDDGREPAYVDPIAAPPYQNLGFTKKKSDSDGSYENVFTCASKRNSVKSVESMDYENAAYLNSIKKDKELCGSPPDDEEGDYINAAVLPGSMKLGLK